MAAKSTSLLDVIRQTTDQQPLLFGEPTRPTDRSAQPIGALVPPGMHVVYALDELPGYQEYAGSNGANNGGWVLDRPGVWHHLETGHWFVEPPRPEQLAASCCVDCKRRRND